MRQALQTSRLMLHPANDRDIDGFCALLWQSQVRRYLCDDQLMPRDEVAAAIRESCDPASITAYWRIERGGAGSSNDQRIGVAGIRPPSRDSLKLRAIGWRSLELIIALDPAHWNHGYAHEAVEAIAAELGRDGVTFAMVAAVDVPNERSHRLMRRCSFVELGRAPGPGHELVIYERAL